MDVNENILDAIQLLANSTVAKASYDKTIEAQILSCQDASVGKYKCQYQDSIIYAYSNNVNIFYKKQDYVYILVPCGDMGKTKTIIGTSDRILENFFLNDVGEQEDLYDIIGNNCIISTKNFYLNSNIQNYHYEIYNYQSSENALNINVDAVNKYLNESSADAFRFSTYVRTNIPTQRQLKGTYGFKFILTFKNTSIEKKEEIDREYIFSEQQMTGNPYNLKNEKQFISFKINGKNFIRIKSIQLFCNNFINAEILESTELIPKEFGDIVFSASSFVGLSSFDKEELKGVRVFFDTPKGIVFSEENPVESLPITAYVKIDGRKVSQEQELKFYWGIEDAGIDKNSYFYNKYLGGGWRCLNKNNKISEIAAQWVPSNGVFIYERNYDEKLISNKNKLRAVVVINDNSYFNEIVISNFNKETSIFLDSLNGTHFYYDEGDFMLKCFNEDGYQYKWGQEDNKNIFTSLSPNEQDASILQSEVSLITDFTIFKCSLYKENNFMGTASIKIYNSIEKNGLNFIQGWNGENVQIAESCILSPLISSGIIDADGNFSGVALGILQQTGKNINGEDQINKKIGLFGYAENKQSFFLNSDNGAAFFGIKEQGGLAIDPSQGNVCIYSSNFWAEENLDEDGFPIDPNYLNINDGQYELIYAYEKNGQIHRIINDGSPECGDNPVGMLIDLANSLIISGNGNFFVNSQGVLKVKNGNLDELNCRILQADQGSLDELNFGLDSNQTNGITIYYSSSVNEPIMRPQLGLDSKPSGFGRLGTGAHPFSFVQAYNIYCNSCTTGQFVSTSSDKKIKNHINFLSDSEDEIAENLIYNLSPVSFSFKNENEKIRFGFYAQDVYNILQKFNLNNSGIVSVFIEENDENIKKLSQKEISNYSEEELKWSLSYEEFIAPLVAVVQKQKQEIDQLKMQIAALKEREK